MHSLDAMPSHHPFSSGLVSMHSAQSAAVLSSWTGLSAWLPSRESDLFGRALGGLAHPPDSHHFSSLTRHAGPVIVSPVRILSFLGVAGWLAVNGCLSLVVLDAQDTRELNKDAWSLGDGLRFPSPTSCPVFIKWPLGCEMTKTRRVDIVHMASLPTPQVALISVREAPLQGL